MNGSKRGLRPVGWVLFWGCLGLLLVTADRRLLLLARNTAWLSVGACLVSLPCGTMLALLLGRTDLPLRRAAWIVVTALLCLPLYLHATAWEAGFGRLGWIAWSGNSLSTPILQGFLAAIWTHGVWGIPWVTLIVSVALQLSEPELEEAALLDASPWRVFWRVTLRRSLPGVMVAAVWIMLMTASEMTVTDLYQIRTLAEELYTGMALWADEQSTFGMPAALLFTLMLTGLAMAIFDGVMVAAAHVPLRPPYRFRLGDWRWPCLAVVSGVLLLLAGVPLTSLVYQAGMVVDHVGQQPIRYWSLARFVELLVPWPGRLRVSAVGQFADQFRWTLLIGMTAATTSTTVGALLAWWARRGGWRVLPAAFLAALGLATMGPLIGLAIIELFSAGDGAWLSWLYSRTIAAPVLAATLRVLPLSILLCWIAFGSLNRETIESAELDGAGAAARWWRIGVGQRRSAVGLVWVVAWILACGELSATILTTPPGLETIPIRVFGLIHAGVSNQVAAVCLTVIAGFCVLATLLTWMKPHRMLWGHRRWQNRGVD